MALKLPVFITSKRDVLRLLREAEVLADSLLQSRIALDKSAVKREIHELSQTMAEFLEVNKIELKEDQINNLVLVLKEVHEKAPQVRLSFASEPDQASLEKLIRWFRDNAHPMIFIQVGIQPTIAGGCVLRTSRHRFDFSLRATLLKNMPKLQEAIANVR